MQNQKTNTLLGMSQGRLGAANLAREQAKQAVIGGIGQLAGGVSQAVTPTVEGTASYG